MRWIPAHDDLPDAPEVLALEALGLGLSPRQGVLGMLVSFWLWADLRAEAPPEDDLLAPAKVHNVTAAVLDRLFGEGFTDGMAQVGWAVLDGKTLLIPGWNKRMSSSAKTRAHDQKRKRLQRERERGSVPDPSESVPKTRTDRDGTVTTGTGTETERETPEPETPLPPSRKGGRQLGWKKILLEDEFVALRSSEAFLTAWETWKTYHGAYKDVTVRSKFKKAQEDISAFCAAVEHSIREGYTGLYAPGNSNGRTPKTGPGRGPGGTYAEQDDCATNTAHWKQVAERKRLAWEAAHPPGAGMDPALPGFGSRTTTPPEDLAAPP